MRLNVNFTMSTEKMRIYMLGCAYGLAAMFAALGIWMAFDAAVMKRELPLLQNTLTRVKSEYASMQKPGPVPSEQEISRLRRSVAAVNSLGIGRSAGISAILRALEKVTPANINLTGFYNELADGSIRLSCRADSAATIPTYIKTLEQQPFFTSITLEKQSQKDPGSGATAVDFTLVLKEARQ